MKKRLFILSLVLFISWCSLKNASSRQKVKWTISYYNFEQDRGSWEETEYWKSHLAVYLSLDSQSPLYKETNWRILIWCISGDNTILYRDLLQIKPSNITSWSYIWEPTKTSPINLPKDLNNQQIEAKVTLPIDLYNLDNDHPDQWRPGSCYAYSDIKDIKNIK